MKQVQRLRMDFYFSRRPWYRKDGSPILSASGVPRDVEDLPRLDRGFKAAFASIGATLERYSKQEYVDSLKNCHRCGKQFKAKRRTARFCVACRDDVYSRRKEKPGYSKLNRKRAREGMARLRSGVYKSQNKRGRRKFGTESKRR